ncbi:MAG: glycoside hydrolase family 127 protein [Gemmataceae bacterium]
MSVPPTLQADDPVKEGAPRFDRVVNTTYDPRGVLADYLRGVSDQWLKVAPAANPGMLEMFRDRDRKPARALEPWAGEFAGKYLTAAVQVLRLTGDPELRAQLTGFVREWVSLQADDGYLGPWPKASRLTGKAPNVGKGHPGDTWDAWGHYHALVGLLLWHDDTGDERAMTAAKRIGDLLCNRFLGDKKPRLVDTGSTEMNLAPVHGLCLLYRKTRDPRHLALAKQLVSEFAAVGPDGKPLAGDYLRAGLAGKEFFATTKPRWESLHPILGLAELYLLTGDESYRRAFEQHWWSIAKLDRHNNGGFSSGEQAQGNPYHPGAIETCCTIAWLAMGVEMLRFTGNPIVADELELSTLNSVLGMHSPTGRWATYNTPMDGVRKASAHDIVFQAREGTPELNCCSVNSARGFGLISDWALMRDADGLVLNWYGPGTLTTPLPSGVSVKLTQDTDYPRDGRVRIVVDPAKPAEFALKLRIPAWSARTTVTLNGAAQPAPTPGTYLTLSHTWKPGDVVELVLDFSPHFWAGERECQGKVSAYRGPLLLTWDRRFNDMDPAEIAPLDADALPGKVVQWPGSLKPILLLEMPSRDGRTVRLCDFASAGQSGSPYRSWLEIGNVKPTEFSRSNPLRSGR